MSEEEKKSIESITSLLKQIDEGVQTIQTENLFINIEIILKLIEKQQKEIEILRNLLYMIRHETKYNTISFENNYYRPIKNVTKQQIYESYNTIRTLVKGNYVMMDNKEAIDSIVEKE